VDGFIKLNRTEPYERFSISNYVNGTFDNFFTEDTEIYKDSVTNGLIDYILPRLENYEGRHFGVYFWQYLQSVFDVSYFTKYK
jgi:hypothetical protein